MITWVDKSNGTKRHAVNVTQHHCAVGCLEIYVIWDHIYQPRSWSITCDALNMEAEPLQGCASLENVDAAKAAAIAKVVSTMQGLLDKLTL